MSDNNPQHDPFPIAYSVRFSEQAQRDAESKLYRLASSQGRDIARQWYEGLYEAAGDPSEQPRRNVVLQKESSCFRLEVRRVLYRRSSTSSIAHLLYYVVLDESDDGPQVSIIHVRHGAARPLTAKEVRQMRGAI